jgi:hypothetical protein
MTPRDVFISHASEDAESARELRSILEGAGYTCWMAPDDIVGTDTWTEQILGAINGSRAMIVLVSGTANASPHVSREVNLALGRRRAVLPIRIEPVAPGGSLEYLLSLVQRVDAFPPPVTDHRERVLRRLEAVLRSPVIDEGAAGTAVQQSPVRPPSVQPPPPPAIVVPTTAPTPTPGAVTTPAPVVSRTSGSRVPIAIVAAVVVVAAIAIFGSGLLGKPGASPTSSTGAVASGSATASDQPPSSDSPTIEPTGGGLTGDQVVLRDRLPFLAGVESCVPWPTPPGGEDVLSPSGYAGSTARISCPIQGSAVPARYALYPTTQALDADFATMMTSQGVAPGGACVTAIPANAPWSFPNSPNSGDLACFERNGKVQYVWTQRQLGVLAQWIAPDNAAGYAFWKTWTSTFNAAETDLMGRLPRTVDNAGSCVRAAERYYAEALALITCPATTSMSIVYYALFPDATAFPDDPMTRQFDLLMQGGGWPDDTAAGCYDETPAYGRYTWAFRDAAGSLGPVEGYLGCYLRPDTVPESAQYVWTYNASAIMGLWAAPDLATGIAFFDGWIANLQR